TARDWVAKASLTSTASTEPRFQPARSSTLRVAGTGPRPMTSGARPALAFAMTRARGWRPYFSTAASLTTRIAEAPSLRVEELPAVTTSPPLTTGQSFARTLVVVPGRGPSSVSSRVTLPLRSVTSTGTISGSKRTASMAARARDWDWTAKASASAREMSQTRATSSAVSGMEYVILSCAANFGLTKRQPMAVSKASPGFANAVVGFSTTHGARDIDSTP